MRRCLCLVCPTAFVAKPVHFLAMFLRDQTKAAEGLFEALPQSMLQAYVVIHDMYNGYEVTPLQVLSLFSSYVSCAIVFFLMGDNINTAWRALFSAYVFVNVVLRSATISFVLVILVHWEYRLLYVVSSMLMTSFFLFVLQKKKVSLSSIILNIIVFLVGAGPHNMGTINRHDGPNHLGS